MKVKSVSGITWYVKNLSKSVKFYEALGFETKKQDAFTQRVTPIGFGWIFSPSLKTNAPNSQKTQT